MNIIEKVIAILRDLFGGSEHKQTPATLHKSRTILDDVNQETTYEEKPNQISKNETKESLEVESVGTLTKEDLFNYLEKAESYSVHYNKGENGKTAPLGVYYKYFPHWEGWRFLTQIAQEYKITFDPSSSNSKGCQALTELVRGEYRVDMDELLFDFIENEYIQTLHLDYFPGKKSALSYFSITVNGGKHRSAKILQKILNTNGANLKVDGKAGEKTYEALLQSGLDDEYLNQQILLKVYNFYNYLIGRNPAKYRKFYNGWINRLKSLGFEEPKE